MTAIGLMPTRESKDLLVVLDHKDLEDLKGLRATTVQVLLLQDQHPHNLVYLTRIVDLQVMVILQPVQDIYGYTVLEHGQMLGIS
jgi:hypothetical protein